MQQLIKIMFETSYLKVDTRVLIAVELCKCWKTNLTIFGIIVLIEVLIKNK